MPVYEIEQYETWAQRYRVEADSETQAIEKLFSGSESALDGALEYNEINTERGLPVNEYPELVKELAKLDFSFGDCMIDSIASIQEICPECTDQQEPTCKHGLAIGWKP